MKHRILMAVAIASLLGALVLAQRQHAQARPSAEPLLYLVADSERDLTTLPSHFTRVSDDDETKYGAELADEYLATRAKLSPDDVDVEHYVKQVGAQLAARAHRRLGYEFHFVPDRNFVNAFALPGGHLFIGAGLIEHMTTEDELAAVLGHEIEHVDHYHCAERLQAEAALRKIPLGAVLQIPVAVFQAGYSKDQEFEADREGVLLAARSGYSAAGAVRAFEMLRDLSQEKEETVRTPQGEMASVAAGVLTGYFRSHPDTEDRIAQVREMIARDPSLASHLERRLQADYIFMAEHALDAVEEGKFRVAADLAQRALQRAPGYPLALRALFEADLGLEQYAAAEDVYRGLLARDAAAADLAETHAEARATHLFELKQYDREIALLESILVVQPSQPRVLRAAAWAYAMKGDRAGANAKAGLFDRLYGDQAVSIASDAERAAGELLGKHDFAPAASMASLAIAFDPARPSAFRIEADAELAQAHFAEAADAYARAYEPTSADPAWLAAFGDALGAAHPQTASRDLLAFLKQRPPETLPEARQRIEAAGLELLSGSDVQAKAVMKAVDSGEIAPELLARLGWWYLRAARTADADAVLTKARLSRPGNDDVLNALAWTSLDLGKPAFLSSGWDSKVCVTLDEWQRGRKKDALAEWPDIVRTNPQWANPAWRQALYPPRVNADAQQIEAEIVRLKSPQRLAARAR
jgi:predicted Zn-dependent protease